MIAVATQAYSSVVGATVGSRRLSLGHAFLDWLAAEPGLDWLEIGCEDGVWTSLIAADHQPRHLIAVDADASKVAVASERLAEHGVRIEHGAPTALPLARASRDLIVGRLGFGGIEAAAPALAETRRVLRSDGQLAICVWDDAEDDLDGMAAPVPALARMVREAGFRSVDTVALPAVPVSAWGLVARA